GDGILDTGETDGLNGVNVTLYLADGTPTGLSNFTFYDGSANGAFSFSVAPGSYHLGFSQLGTGYALSPEHNPGAPDADHDSDANATIGSGSYGLPQNITVTSNQTFLTLDAGVYQNATINPTRRSYVLGDGILDTGETDGLNGVNVTLYLADGTPT